MVEFILYSRVYCHLCDDMLLALRAFEAEYTFSVTVEDVDADPALLEQYDELVPVLMGKRGHDTVRLCHYFLDAERVKTFLRGELSLAG